MFKFDGVELHAGVCWASWSKGSIDIPIWAPVCVVPLASIKKGFCTLSSGLTYKRRSIHFYFLSKVSQTWGLRTCVDTKHMHVLWFGQRQNQTKPKEEIYVEHEGQLRRSKAESLSHFGGCCFAKINAFFVCVSVYTASEVHLIVYPYFCPPTEVQCNFYELFWPFK